jgi:hypothetical protein
VGIAAPSPAGATTTITPAEAERQFTDLLNQARHSQGLAPLVVTSSIVQGSRTWSAKLQSDGVLSHDPNLAGFMNHAVPGWTRIGENVGYGPSVQTVHDAFWASTGHRQNMLGDYNQVGIGVTINSHGTIWVTVRFAKGPIPRPPSRPDRIAVRSADQLLLRSSLSAGTPTTSYSYGSAGDVTLFGDWNGDGVDTPAVYRSGVWKLRNSNSGGSPDVIVSYGGSGDIPVVGDWDGNGTDTIGVVSRGIWKLRNSNTGGSPSLVLSYGSSTDKPVTGDWDGNGTTTVGVRSGSTWKLRNANNGGSASAVFSFGNASDVPLVGDWDGNGTDTIGARRGGTWFVRNANSNGTYSSFTYGSSSEAALVGGF